MISLERLTVPVLEAAVVGCVRSSIEVNGNQVSLSPERHMEASALVRLCQESVAVREILQGMLDFLNDGDATMQEKLDFVFQQSFIFGWHARGAIEEDERLQQLLH